MNEVLQEIQQKLFLAKAKIINGKPLDALTELAKVTKDIHALLTLKESN